MLKNNSIMGGKVLAFLFFTLFYLPSIKLIYSSGLLNIIIISILFIFAIFAKFDPSSFSFSAFLLIVFCILYSLFAVLGVSNSNSEDLFRQIYFVAVIICSFLLVKRISFSTFINLVLLWSLILSLWQLFFHIKLDLTKGQTYLTVSAPIGSGIVAAFSLLFTSKESFKTKLPYLIVLIINYLAIGTLMSRSGLLYPTLLILLIAFIKFINTKSLDFPKKITIMVVSTILVVFVVGLVVQSGVFKQIDRITRIVENTQSEPRLKYYFHAFDLINQKPFLGYGSSSSDDLFWGKYPHNLFLESFIIGGIIFAFPILIYTFLYFFYILKYSKLAALANKYTWAMFGVSSFFFLQWNSSFDFATAYIPFITMFFFINMVNLEVENNLENRIENKNI